MSQTYLWIVSHGILCESLVDSASMIVGKPQRVKCFPLYEGVSGAEYRKQLEDSLHEVPEGSNILVLADLYGGTPCNTALMMLRDRSLSVVSGVNLPMLLEALEWRDSLSIDDLVSQIIATGVEGTANVTEKFHRVRPA